ncbi:T9SS type A sorting domain-containing protein [uncultured Draconibacterium sp.]|uniref:PKD domain-containing protein n=1 Tax=uncultured Draconibacterium sp. TaxID=1573823 RepID=UPI0032179878
MRLYLLPILLSLFIFVNNSFAQTHFYPVGNLTNAMNVNLLEAKINGVNLREGDEIGVFDGELCVGAVVLEKSLEEIFDNVIKSLVAGGDDSETYEKDGFITENTISFKIWDKSENQLIEIETVKYYNPIDGSEIEEQHFAVGATRYVSLNTTFNYAPKSNAGTDQVLREGESGMLDGTGSFDLNEDDLSYVWYDLDSIGLKDFNVVKPTFSAPKVDSDKHFRLVLIVNDGSKYSEPDTTGVTVLNVVSEPVANAGVKSIEVNELKKIILNGSKSYDPEDMPITWHWELSENTIELVNNNSAVASFYAPEVRNDTTIYAYLTIINSAGLTASDTVEITIHNVNIAPMAVIVVGSNVVKEGEEVVLDGSHSHDQDSGPSHLRYNWNSLNGGELNNRNEIYAVFSAPFLLLDSTFLFTLVVNDGDIDSPPDTIAVKVLHTNLSPTANAGFDIIVDEGGEVVLNSSSSFDPEGKELIYEWNSDCLDLNDFTSPFPQFIAPEQEKDTTVFLSLKVNDGELWSVPDTLEVHIRQVNKVPVWLALPADSAFLERAYMGFIEAYDPDLLDALKITAYGMPGWLTMTDHGDGTAELYADSIPGVDGIKGDWDIVLQISDGYISVDTSFTLHVGVVTFSNKIELPSFMIFPNPSNEWITIQFDKPLNKGSILRFYTASGVLVREELIVDKILNYDVSEFSRGVYLLELITENTKLKTLKLLIN